MPGLGSQLQYYTGEFINQYFLSLINIFSHTHLGNLVPYNSVGKKFFWSCAVSYVDGEKHAPRREPDHCKEVWESDGLGSNPGHAIYSLLVFGKMLNYFK